jgi:hypothetical protein
LRADDDAEHAATAEKKKLTPRPEPNISAASTATKEAVGRR